MLSEYEKQDIGQAYYQDGFEEAKVSIAKTMLSDGVDPEYVIKYFGLSKEEVEALKGV